jgi:hypothetical protein
MNNLKKKIGREQKQKSGFHRQTRKTHINNNQKLLLVVMVIITVAAILSFEHCSSKILLSISINFISLYHSDKKQLVSASPKFSRG